MTIIIKFWYIFFLCFPGCDFTRCFYVISVLSFITSLSFELVLFVLFLPFFPPPRPSSSWRDIVGRLTGVRRTYTIIPKVVRIENRRGSIYLFFWFLFFFPQTSRAKYIRQLTTRRLILNRVGRFPDGKWLNYNHNKGLDFRRRESRISANEGNGNLIWGVLCAVSKEVCGWNHIPRFYERDTKENGDKRGEEFELRLQRNAQRPIWSFLIPSYGFYQWKSVLNVLFHSRFWSHQSCY